MLGYLLAFAFGVIVGLLVEDALTTETKVVNDVKIKQRGRDNKLDVTKSIEAHINKRKEKRKGRKRIFKRKSKKK